MTPCPFSPPCSALTVLGHLEIPADKPFQPAQSLPRLGRPSIWIQQRRLMGSFWVSAGISRSRLLTSSCFVSLTLLCNACNQPQGLWGCALPKSWEIRIFGRYHSGSTVTVVPFIHGLCFRVRRFLTFLGNLMNRRGLSYGTLQGWSSRVCNIS